jgi:DNA-directed RNA polymerase specialized sigma24 family protein
MEGRMNIEDLLPTLQPVVDSVSSDAVRKYRRFGMEHDDASQECLLWILDHPAKVIAWFDEDNYSPRQAENLLARSLRNQCIDYGEDLKAQSVGYNREDLAYYSKQYLRELLPLMFDREAWIYPEKNSGERISTGGDPAHGGNWITTLADVSRAYAKLDGSDRDLLARFHRDGDTNDEIARQCGVSKQTMSDWHDRAVGRLLKLLGGHKPASPHDEECDHWVTGSRHAVSNAAARAYQQSIYEE